MLEREIYENKGVREVRYIVWKKPRGVRGKHRRVYRVITYTKEKKIIVEILNMDGQEKNY